MSRKARAQSGRRQKAGGRIALSKKTPFKRALALQEQGKLAEAEVAYRQILETQPDNLDARNNLGNVLRDSGKPEAALECYQKTIATNPNYALAHFNMGTVMRRVGTFEEAAACYRRSLELRPDFVPACINLGVTLHELHNLDEAAAWLYRAVTLDPKHALAHLNLGNVLRDQGKFAEAESCYRRAIEISPRYMEAHCNLGSVLRSQDRLDESFACYNRARKMDPNHPLVHFGLADTLRAQGKREAAVAGFRKAISLNPKNADIHNNLGNVLRLLERMDEAQECYRTAMALDPDHPDAPLNFAIEQPFTPDDPNFDRLVKQLEHPATSEDKRIQLIFALARGYEAAGQYDNAMEQFSRGNALKRKTVSFERPAHREMLKDVQRYFAEARTMAGAPLDGQVPVFLLGLSRSGKTLAESLLKQDPRIFGGGERYYFIDAMHAIRRENNIEAFFPDCVPQFDETMVADLSARYMASMRKLSDAPILLNTLPGHYLHLGWIFWAMPNARVIYCRREPLDQCLRIFFKLYARENAHAYRWEDIAAHHDGYHSTMAHWRRLYGERILEVKYEEMVQQPQVVAGRMFAHLGLDRDTADIHADFSTVEIGHWQNYKAHLGPLQAALAGLIV